MSMFEKLEAEVDCMHCSGTGYYGDNDCPVCTRSVRRSQELVRKYWFVDLCIDVEHKQGIVVEYWLSLLTILVGVPTALAFLSIGLGA